MWIRLVAGLMACTAGVAWAGAERQTIPRDGLRAFLLGVVNGEPRSPRHYAQELSPLRHRSGQGSVLPTLTVTAGKLGEGRCVYQLRVETWTLDGSRADADMQSTGGRSTLKQAPCETLVQEVIAVAEYEVGSLQRRVLHGAPRASNQARDAVVAAVREGGARRPAVNAPVLWAQTLPARVNLRAAPSLKARVLRTLPPSSRVELVPTQEADWYALRNGPGFLHLRALQGRPAPVTAAPQTAMAEPVLRATLRDAYVTVHEAPNLRARVLTRLKPKAEVRLQPARQGWHRLADRPGYIPTAALAGAGDDKGVSMAEAATAAQPRLRF